MADILPSYTYSKEAGRFRSSETGRFVSRDNITNLMVAHVDSAENRLGDLATSFAEKRIDASTWAISMRDEVRRLTLINEGLGSHGIQNLTPQQTGRAGGELRERYQRISANAQQFANGEISQAQLMARVNSMVGECRLHYWKAEREAARPQDPANVLIERRVISGGETCEDCLDYYAQGFQELGVLPAPCEQSVCQGNCKCRLERKEVPFESLAEHIGTKK